MVRCRHWWLLSAVVLVIPASAHASIVSFDFNTLSDGASNSAVQTYMRNVLTNFSAGSVSVSGAVGEANYNGDNHVVGPTSGQSVSSETLGTSDGGVHHNGGLDTFLVNSTSTDRITMTFTNPIYVVSFDYEIFPDQTCQSSQCNPTNWPDFTFAGNGAVQFHTQGIVPGQQGTDLHSPFSGANSNELAPQFLGTSGLWFFINGITKLEFIDWPRQIGIDNLRLGNNPCDIPGRCGPVIPEPSSLLLMGSGLLGGAIRSRRKRAYADLS